MGFPPLKQVRCSIPDGHADATEAYERALFDLYSEVTEDADKVRFGVPVLPAPSNQVEDYLLFHLSVANPKGEDIETVILAIRIYDLCIVGFKSRFAAFFYKDGPPLHIQQQIFPGLGEAYFTVACHIFFGDKRTLSLGFGVLVQEIKHLAAQRSGFGNGRNPFGDTDDGIINGLCVCEQMFTESIRFPNIKKELIKVASLAWNANGCLEYPACILSPHLVHMQKKWKLFYGPITQDGKSQELKEKVKFRYLDEQFNKVTAVYKELSQLKNIIALIPGNWEWELQQVQIYDVDDYEDDDEESSFSE